jgi:molybdenum cofactor cytidylyltransferase
MKKSKNLAILILAAGTSSRLGNTTKQLLKYKSESFLKIAVKKAIKVSDNIFVVLGHKKDECQKELEGFNINILYNENYKKGIGSTISLGIEHTKDYENTMIMLCDQPFIKSKHLLSLKNNIDNKTIIASHYEQNDDSTVPAIFPKKYYKKLLKLNKDKGAKSIIKKENCISIKLQKEQSIDIDTPNDISVYLNL